MVVIPGLSRLLAAAGKHITSWDDSGVESHVIIFPCAAGRYFERAS